VNLGDILKTRVSARLQALGIDLTIAPKNIGYELRCVDPIPFDIEYTRSLGYCAAKYLIAGGNAVMVSLQNGEFVPVPFSTMINPDTGKTRVRRVNIESTHYAIARRFMIRLRRDDFSDPYELSRLAATAASRPTSSRPSSNMSSITSPKGWRWKYRGTRPCALIPPPPYSTSRRADADPPGV
jgi:6-phosphofructokinase 1